MPTFDENTLQSYFDTRDYFGAAEYLSSISAASGELQAQLNTKIRELRIKGERQSAMLEKGDIRDQDAYHFISALDGNGTIPHRIKDSDRGNEYGDTYLGLINNLRANSGNISPGGRDVGGEQINRIRLEFNNSEAYKTYLDSLGVTYDNVENLGVSWSRDSKTGHTIIDIPTSNVKLIDLLSKTSKLDEPYIVTGAIALGQGYAINFPSQYAIKGITSSNIVVDSNNFNYNNIRQAKRLVTEARENQNNLINTSKSVTTLEDMVVTPYLGHGHANAYDRYKRGEIDINDYNKIVKERTDIYNRLLQLTDFQHFDIYGSGAGVDGMIVDNNIDNDSPTRVLQQVKPEYKAAIKEVLKVAMDENRVTYSAGMRNGVIGAYISVTQQTDSKGNAVKGEYGQNMTLFIPGLFKSSCDEAFNHDTRQMAVRDNADMKRWNYGKFLTNGNYIGYDKVIGSYMLQHDEYGNNVKIPVTEEVMLQELNRENIVQNSIDALLRNIGDDGKPLQHVVNGKMVPYDLDYIAQYMSAEGVQELYPKGAYTDGERLQYQAEIYNSIMSEIRKRMYKNK